VETPDRAPSTGVGGLRWGLRSSVLQYVAGLPDGQCSVTDGAALAPGPVFVFEPDEPAWTENESGR
jgi:hypothetical protein